MNAGQLIDFVRTFLKFDAPNMELPATAHLIDLLNRAQDEMSVELGVPTKYIEVTNQSTPFNLPADARDTDPLIEVRYAPGTDRTVNLPLMSIERAGVLYPNWMQDTSTGDPVLCIVGGPTDSLADVYPYPDPGTGNFYVLYKIEPDDMTELSDTPFNGELERFHIALSHYVAFMLAGNDQRYAIYRDFLDRASSVRKRGPRVSRNALYSMGSRWAH
jgi:hypothetical protein